MAFKFSRNEILIVNTLPTVGRVGYIYHLTTNGKKYSYNPNLSIFEQIGQKLFTVGDIKTGIQSTDHDGWIKLDGRLKSTLNATQQTNATALGIGTNLPNASNSVLMQNGTTLGSVTGSNSRKILQKQLPNVDLPLIIDPVTATNQNAGAHNHTFMRPNGGATYNNGGGNTWWGPNSGVTVTTSTNGDHTHLQNPHTHTGRVTLNGGLPQVDLDITPRALSVNVFIYLGE